MRALLFTTYGGPLAVTDVPDPATPPDGVVLAVGASGICRSDWHGWQGHDPDIALPHVGGHELAGSVVAVGPQVTRWRVGDRVTTPFVLACGRCPRCAAGDQQVCDAQEQPGFTRWGSFAGLVALPRADVNLVALPDDVTATTAAALGCRYATAYRAVVQQGRVRPGDWLAVHGCGGVGLSAVQIAVAAGARVVAVDVSPAALELAGALGAEHVLDARDGDPAAAIHDLTGGGAAVSLDALGSATTCVGSIMSLGTRGRHVQVGLLPPELGRPPVPMDRVLARELELLGSHGMAAHAYPELLGLVAAGRLRPQELVTRELPLDAAGPALVGLGEPGAPAGIAVITTF